MCDTCGNKGGIPMEYIISQKEKIKQQERERIEQQKKLVRKNLWLEDTCVNGHDVRDKALALSPNGSCRKCVALISRVRRQAKIKPADEIPRLKMEIKRLLAETNHRETLEQILELLDQPAFMPS